jgi:hypothetical protein
VTAVVFSGPTLSPAEAARLFPEARCLGPAAQGDVWLACRARPHTICLIDGYFEHTPAVTHKELLWALHAGTRVYGAASMGALRAVELSPFGMEGHGAIYEAFARGELEDDDEVAVAHADAEHGFRAASDALVNVRATLARALRLSVLTPQQHDDVLAAAKQLFYAERTLVRAIETSELPTEEQARLREYFAQREHRVDQKRADAEALLRHARSALTTPAATDLPDFPYTDAWAQIVREHELRATANEEGVLEELQLLGPEVFSELLFAATRRALARTCQPPCSGTFVTDAAVERAHERALLELPHVLQGLGDLDRVRGRAAQKAAQLDGRAAAASDRDVAAYFSSCLQRGVPDDLTSYAASVGFGSEHLLRVSIARELAYRRT